MKSKFLVVDDDPIVLAIVKERLESLGHHVTTRQDALGTTQWVSEHQPDFLLLDISMPALSGRELSQLLKQRDRTRSVGVILYSGLPREELEHQVRMAGAIGGISKADSEERFLSELQRIMARHLRTSR